MLVQIFARFAKDLTRGPHWSPNEASASDLFGWAPCFPFFILTSWAQLVFFLSFIGSFNLFYHGIVSSFMMTSLVAVNHFTMSGLSKVCMISSVKRHSLLQVHSQLSINRCRQYPCMFGVFFGASLGLTKLINLSVFVRFCVFRLGRVLLPAPLTLCWVSIDHS